MPEKTHISFGHNLEVEIPSEKLAPGAIFYMAGGLGFAESSRRFHEQVCELVTAMGGTALDPFLLTDPHLIENASALPYGQEQRATWQALNSIIGANNVEAIRKSSGIVANLDGVDVDSGTAAEIGFAYGLGKPIIGYRTDFRLSSDNVGSIVNLQVEFFIRESGGKKGNIVTSIVDLPKELLRVWGTG